ncbi:MAG: CotH kinase family protein [Candidatus Brachytrichaceae bacterium NZ_4S206]
MSKTHSRTKVSKHKKRPAGWSKKSHSNDVAPNYDVVFPKNAVNTLMISIAPDDWVVMEADMEEIYAPSLYIRKGILAAGPNLSKEERKQLLLKLFSERSAHVAEAQATDAPPPMTPTAGEPSAKDRPSEGAAAGAGAIPTDQKQLFVNPAPKWVPATITFQGREWQHVGVRYKGASSLSPWVMGEMRLPFKLDFDRFEKDYPEIKNQRFFGFKELSLANNYEDPAGMRDMLVYALLAEAGLPSLRAAPYEVVLDYGEGPVRLGLYTMIEVVDDTGVASYFGSDNGNIYEGEGRGASLASEVSHLLEDSFQKKNNEDNKDWSDIWALYNVLHSPQRTSDPEAWRAGLEAVFDGDGFLEWLGIAAVVGHGDTYGAGPHNFYLYHNPATGKLTWFSWDHNLTFSEGVRKNITLDRSTVSEAWPLIRYLLDDPVYWDRYVELLRENFATMLAPDAMIARIRARAEVIKPVATQDMSAEEYDAAVQELVDFVTARAAEVEAFLAGQPHRNHRATGDQAPRSDQHNEGI